MAPRPLMRVVTATFLVMFATACTTTGGGSAGRPGDESMSADQRTLHEYSAENTSDYTLVAAAGGAALGCLAGALLSDNKALGCGAGALAGGMAGGAGGYYLAQAQNRDGTVKAGYNLERSKLDQDAAQSQAVLRAATNVANTASADVVRLQKQVAAGQASRDQLVARMEEAQRDKAAMGKAIQKIEGRIELLSKDIQSGQASSKDLAVLKSTRDKLIRQKQEMQKEIDRMPGTVG